ncbi:probable transcription factor PosF21 [Diospyros lotus]|uniref:probable transcription factor PosF21 n=1 Tax=Diospyros lotus TaxID=55363 RepID=UPI00224DEBC8|nr:probable transcription factor PosF21 [Diospyros lotus]XP_052207562.1 probable transcription factor PosF21 [Diospyros lotus]
MPDNPRNNLGHRRAHSEILTLPDDISFDSDLGVVGGLDGPSLSDETEEDFLSIYLDMDKFNSSSATSAFLVGGPSSAAGSASALNPASTPPVVPMGSGSNERPRVRHQHSQSMDGSTTIKPEMLMSGTEESSAADSKKAISAARIDPMRAKSSPFYVRVRENLSMRVADFHHPLWAPLRGPSLLSLTAWQIQKASLFGVSVARFPLQLPDYIY